MWWPIGFRAINRRPLGADRGLKAPKRCPRCGMQMVTRVIYYECEGCGHTVKAPSTGRTRDNQPVDNFKPTHQMVHASVGSSWESDFALAVVPPHMAREYRGLMFSGAMVMLFILCWIAYAWFDDKYQLGYLFRLCWTLVVIGMLYLGAALALPYRIVKRLGVIVALAVVFLSICTAMQIPSSMVQEVMKDTVRLTTMIASFITLKIYHINAVYCLWLAWYLDRERQLR